MATSCQKFHFRHPDDDIPIESVEKVNLILYVLFYNIGDPNYMNIILKDGIWREISTKTGKPW